MNSKYSCWVYQIRVIVVDDDSIICSYIPFRHKHIVFSFVPRVCTVSNHDLHSNIRNWSRDDLCFFAKLTPVHTTDVKDFCKIDRNHKKKTPNSQFFKDYIRLLRLFLYFCSEALWHFTYFKVLQIYTDFRTFAADFEYSNQEWRYDMLMCLCFCSCPSQQ